MNFSNLLIHCSAYSKLTTQPKSAADKAAGVMSATTKAVVRALYIEERYSRKKEIMSKHMEKGILQENAAIELYSKFKKKKFIKNTIRIEDKYMTGEPDLTDAENILETIQGVDIKCVWTIHSFPFPDDKLDEKYEWQNHGYMRLTGAKSWVTAYCLVNAPAHLITAEKKSLWYKIGQPEQIDLTDVEKYQQWEIDLYLDYIEKCIEIEKNMIYNMADFKRENPNFDLDCTDWHYDIPINERVREFVTLRDDEKINSMPAVVEGVRNYLTQLNMGGL